MSRRDAVAIRAVASGSPRWAACSRSLAWWRSWSRSGRAGRSGMTSPWSPRGPRRGRKRSSSPWPVPRRWRWRWTLSCLVDRAAPSGTRNRFYLAMPECASRRQGRSACPRADPQPVAVGVAEAQSARRAAPLGAGRTRPRRRRCPRRTARPACQAGRRLDVRTGTAAPGRGREAEGHALRRCAVRSGRARCSSGWRWGR